MNEYKQYGIALLLLVLLGGAVYFVGKRLYPVQDPGPQMSQKVNGNATTFANVGLVTFQSNDPGPQFTPFFTYTVAHGTSTATSTLVFDELSFCSASNGSVPCMAMSVTFDVPFGNKQAIVEGIQQGSEILVRKLNVVPPGQIPIVPQVGSTFISWPQAINFIESCGVKMVMQSHALDVYLTFHDNTQLRTVEPTIDAIFPVVEKAKSSCGDIIIATE